ncbi:hypothetical protein KHQ08_16300 [Pseudochrobactrum algeriensis]|nr:MULTISPECIES: hypothetical protein [Pseudochrobactrum]MDM8347236.1 hypothetical protein [Pseudochrobactrum sp. sp1633]QVQ36634.1 hypothetical protein KHQ08_16300 [Pseudochrobactrum algeriensis]QVQ39849.1 hypothetical protein KHQ07_14565 [Pseudochrobactrum algeriensis]QVQ43771.1 hypothetical protein KHQ09_16525 [Pseudochrobactrum algeriensis]
MTLTDDNDMAAAAMIGDRSRLLLGMVIATFGRHSNHRFLTAIDTC